MIDLLLPEGLERQRKQPITATGRPGLAIEGGNQALLRAQRLPVRIGARVGYVRRPSLLGALVIKAAALSTDNRNLDRHREDLALLGQVALITGFRLLDIEATPHDRKRLRSALEGMPRDHLVWGRIVEPAATFDALSRLARARPDIPT